MTQTCEISVLNLCCLTAASYANRSLRWTHLNLGCHNYVQNKVRWNKMEQRQSHHHVTLVRREPWQILDVSSLIVNFAINFLIFLEYFSTLANTWCSKSDRELCSFSSPPQAGNSIALQRLWQPDKKFFILSIATSEVRSHKRAPILHNLMFLLSKPPEDTSM